MVHNVQLEHDTALLAALGATIVVRLDDRKLATIPATEPLSGPSHGTEDRRQGLHGMQ
jgi:hypothetical protein